MPSINRKVNIRIIIWLITTLQIHDLIMMINNCPTDYIINNQKLNYYSYYKSEHVEHESWNLKYWTSRAWTVYTLCFRNHHVLQRSNQEMMMDRGVFDGVPDFIKSWNLKHGPYRTCTVYTLCFWNHHVLQGSNQEMVDRGVFDGVPDIIESWNLKHEPYRTCTVYTLCLWNHHVLQRSNQEMMDRGCLWWGSWHHRELNFGTWDLQDMNCLGRSRIL